MLALLSQHKSPDYSAVYVVFQTDGETGVEGHGLTFTLGRGNELGTLKFNFFPSSKNTIRLS